VPSVGLAPALDVEELKHVSSRPNLVDPNRGGVWIVIDAARGWDNRRERERDGENGRNRQALGLDLPAKSLTSHSSYREKMEVRCEVSRFQSRSNRWCHERG